MSVAPYSINGGSVNSGGSTSCFSTSARVATAAAASQVHYDDEDDEVAAVLATVGATVERTDPGVLARVTDPFVMLSDDAPRQGTPSPTAFYLAPLSRPASTAACPTPPSASSTGSLPTFAATAAAGTALPARRRGRDPAGQPTPLPTRRCRRWC
jgi:hypothetical protein